MIAHVPVSSVSGAFLPQISGEEYYSFRVLKTPTLPEKTISGNGKLGIKFNSAVLEIAPPGFHLGSKM